MFDLSADPGAIAAALSCDPALAPLVAARPGLRVPGGWDGFEVAVRAILGQQVTVKAATQLAAKIVAKLGTPVAEEVETPGLTQVFPPPDRFDAAVLGPLGMPGSRSGPRRRSGRREGQPTALRPPPRPRRRGRAPVRASRHRRVDRAYIAMRALGETDAFLAGDIGVQRGLVVEGRRPTGPELVVRAERWRPWRAYAVLHLWMGESASPPLALSKAEPLGIQSHKHGLKTRVTAGVTERATRDTGLQPVLAAPPRVGGQPRSKTTFTP